MKLKTNDTALPKRKRIFLVDQSPLARLAVAQQLQQTPGLAVCGHADNATVALAAIGQSRPDIVVTDIIQDLSFIRNLHRRHPRLPILVFSARDEACYAPRALEAGADGYLLKEGGRDLLVESIRHALAGRLVLSPQMRYRLLAKCVKHRARRSGPRQKQCRSAARH
jgi:DNA-binding NarL/FixJ family response regulator